MSPQSPAADEIIERLERLWRKLEDEGRYTDANTVGLAIDQLKRKTA